MSDNHDKNVRSLHELNRRVSIINMNILERQRKAEIKRITNTNSKDKGKSLREEFFEGLNID